MGQLGILFYAIEELQNCENTKIKMSYLEIYNEIVKDLISKETNLSIQEKVDEIEVQNLTKSRVKNINQVLELVKIGNQNKKIAKTRQNEKSSRSHSIIQFYVTKKLKTGSFNCKLSFVDLAGSERNQGSDKFSIRMVEGANINKSLLALGRVINKLSQPNNSQKKEFISYRDSKLTRILKDSLGGNSRTVVVTCICSNIDQIDETIHSLNYATRIRKIKNNIKKPLENFSDVDFF